MKKLLLFAALAATLSLSCGKEPKVNDDDDDAPQEEDVIQITKFSLHCTSLQMSMAMKEGQILQIDEISPRKAPLDLLKCTVEDESIVSVKRNEYGFRLIPKAIGKTKVTVSALSGPADDQVCNVEVMEAAMYNTTVLTSISAEQTEFELSDQPASGGAMKGDKVTIPIILEPAEATMNDVDYYTDRPEILNVTPSYSKNQITIECEPNLDNKESVTGTFHVYIYPKRGDAKQLDIKVTVFGHVYGFTFDGVVEGNPGVEEINGELGLNITVGDEIPLKPEILKTGPLKGADPEVKVKLCEAYMEDSLIESEEKCIEINDKGVLKAIGNTVHSVQSFYIAAYQTLKEVYAKFPIKIWDPTEKIEILCLTSDYDHIYNVGNQCSFQAAITPSTARQDFDWSFDNTYLQEVKRDGRYKITFKCLKGSYDGVELKAVSKANENKYGRLSVLINDYIHSDIKVGDWVYYNSSTKAFRVSDGGLRILQKGKYRDDKVGPAPQSNEEVVGLIFNMDVDADAFPVKLAGYNGKHFRVISLSEGESQKWSDTNYSLEEIYNAWEQCGAYSAYGKAPFEGAGNSLASTTYENNLGWLKYNMYFEDKGDATNKIKAMYSLEKYTGDHPIKTATSLQQGASGWLLMTTRDASILFGDVHDILSINRLKEFGFKHLGHDNADVLYWTCEFTNVKGKACLVGWNKVGNKYVHDEHRMTSEYNTRPIFYL